MKDIVELTDVPLELLRLGKAECPLGISISISIEKLLESPS